MDTRTRVENLYRGARRNQRTGNTMIASWMHESAEYYHSIQQSNEEFLDKFLVRKETVRHTRREEFTSQWYDYEEEYAYNFCGLE